MKTFKELTIDVSGEEDQKNFIARVIKNLPSGWKHDRKAEISLSGITSANFHCFSCDEPVSTEVALLTIVKTTSGNQLYVSNIVPKNVAQLSTDQYNEILSSFTNSCIAPIATSEGCNYTMTSDEWLSAKSS